MNYVFVPKNQYFLLHVIGAVKYTHFPFEVKSIVSGKSFLKNRCHHAFLFSKREVKKKKTMSTHTLSIC